MADQPWAVKCAGRECVCAPVLCALCALAALTIGHGDQLAAAGHHDRLFCATCQCPCCFNCFECLLRVRSGRWN